jgi:hypothetical protein
LLGLTPLEGTKRGLANGYTPRVTAGGLIGAESAAFNIGAL